MSPRKLLEGEGLLIVAIHRLIVTATAASVDWISLSPTHRVPECFTEGLGQRGLALSRAQLLELCSKTRGSFVPRNVKVGPGRYRNGRWISSRPPDPQREKHAASCSGQAGAGGRRRTRSGLIGPSLRRPGLTSFKRRRDKYLDMKSCGCTYRTDGTGSVRAQFLARRMGQRM